MAKRGSNVGSEPSSPSDLSAGEQKMMDIAEGLGEFLGRAEHQWNAWRGQRDTVIQNLTAIRDRATRLLTEVGVAHNQESKRRGRPPSDSAAPPLRSSKGKRKGGLSPEGRARIAAAQKARWAQVRAAAAAAGTGKPTATGNRQGNR